jgi:hypothetical protein
MKDSKNIIGFIHGEMNLDNILMLETETEKFETSNFVIIGFSKLNITLYIYDLANCICDCIIQVVSSNDVDLKDKDGILRIKSIYDNILNGYKSLYQVEQDELILLNHCLLYRLTFKIIKHELNHKSSDKDVSRKFFNSCWSFFEILFLNKFNNL